MATDAQKYEADRKKYEAGLALAQSRSDRDEVRKKYDTDLHRLARQTNNSEWREFLESRRRFIKNQMGS